MKIKFTYIIEGIAGCVNEIFLFLQHAGIDPLSPIFSFDAPFSTID